jgi:hypothetical protein
MIYAIVGLVSVFVGLEREESTFLIDPFGGSTICASLQSWISSVLVA